MTSLIEDTPSLPQTLPVLPRLDSLDLLRGLAILGIFLMNTQSMGLPSSAYYNPTDYGDFTGINWYAWVIVHIFADMKFITTFSILFGAGILLQGQRAASKGLNPWAIHYKRMAVLLVFGLIHAHVFWMGDILVAYATCGMILLPLRKLPASILAMLGIGLICVAPLIRFASAYELWQPLLTLDDLSQQITSHAGGLADELIAYRGSWIAQEHVRFWFSLDNESASFLLWAFWRCGGCMLLGMALQKIRFFHCEWPRQAYSFIACVLIPIGWAITGIGIIYNSENGWSWGYDVSGLWTMGEQFNYWGSLIAAFGYLCVGARLAISVADHRRSILSLLAVPIRAVGRTALSNYFFQTLVGTTLFYGHGFGKFGYLSRIELVELTVCVWVIQLIASTIWVRFFRQGPFEWLWHFIVYGRPRSLAVAVS